MTPLSLLRRRALERAAPALLGLALFLLPLPGLAPPAASPGAAPLAGAVPQVVEPATASLVDRAEAVRAPSGMVVSASAIASEVGRRVLEQGGSAVDAAVATGFALAVTYPGAGNIGGGGFMVVRRPDGAATTFDFRERAPLASHPEMFLDEGGEYSSEIHHDSHVAVGVPGTVAGFALAHERFGDLPWATLVEPAVELAREGFEVPEGLAGSLGSVLPRMREYPASVEAFSRDGTPYAPGEVWRQPDLARTLERIAREGRDGFYRGETARLLVQEMERGGGLFTLEDLERYEAVEREPIRGTFRDWEIISMPPPSSGGVALVEMLNILEGFDLAAMGPGSADWVHHLVEAMRRAYRDRALHLADTDHAEVPIERLTSKAYAEELRETIDPDRAGDSDPADIMVAPESPQTTHYSVVDGDGLAVSVTYTLEAGYGSKITVPGAGFLLNNEMGDFNAAPGLTNERGLIGTDPNLARPGQRMLSSMTPTILARDGELVAVIGSPGGRTIINTVLETTLYLTEHGMDLATAIGSPRLHHQWLPDRVRIEEGGVTPEVLRALEAMGHDVDVGGRQGSVHGIAVDPATGERIGVADPRDEDAGASGHD